MKFILLAAILMPCLTFSNEKTFDSFYEEAQTCENITCIRKEIDRINTEILKFLAERTAYVKRAGDLKSQTHKIADDRQRVADQEKSLIEKSEKLKLPIEISLPAFKAIVDASIEFQQKHIDEISK